MSLTINDVAVICYGYDPAEVARKKRLRADREAEALAVRTYTREAESWLTRAEAAKARLARLNAELEKLT